MYRFGDTGGVKKDAIIAFVLGVVAGYLVLRLLGPAFGGDIVQTLIVIAVASGWYHWRNVL